MSNHLSKLDLTLFAGIPDNKLGELAPALLAECVRLRAEYESMRLAGRELAADLDAAESLIYRADCNLTDFGEVRKTIKRRRKEMAKEAKDAKHE